MNIIRNVHHIAIICSDYDISKKFYTGILGFKIEKEIFRKERQSYKADLYLDGKYILELFSFPDPPARLSRPEATGLRHLAFSVDSIDDTVTYLQTKNIFCEPLRIDEFTNKKFTFIFDPDGLPIELYEI